MHLNFNKIFVIQSLNPDREKLTGTLLYNEVLQFFKYKYPDKDAELIDVDDKEQLFNALQNIEHDCLVLNVKPIIHFEVHGLEGGSGIALNFGQVSWIELNKYFTKINIASSWNLYLTMAVCYGSYAMQLIKPISPAPFAGIVGSFNLIEENDLYIRYHNFYSELLGALNFDTALEALYRTNPNLPNGYGYIGSERMFKNVYQDYFDKEFSQSAMKRRFDNAVKDSSKKFINRKDKRQQAKQFRRLLLQTKKRYYTEHKAKFFMFEKYPEHEKMYCLGWEPKYR
ncbi:hypothetical protein [Pontibacter akesuensis]|uniref:Uncharacterized protein n=1 Tax=Pontibacter akesuensis TaxID=388950 RepID=A0A1I7IMT3_9BACT|nr:hypothetical protein [Pontibacter akesuensis]SFU74228.1 hypothetical protein SAMN04487941_2332 [Pontibacter akesuensis]